MAPLIPQNLRIYGDDLIRRDLRTIGGTSLDLKFLVGGPKSIYTTGNPGVTVKLGTLSEKTRKSGKTNNLIEEILQAYQYRIWNSEPSSRKHYKDKIKAFWAKLGLFWDHFWTFLGFLVVIFIKMLLDLQKAKKECFLTKFTQP